MWGAGLKQLNDSKQYVQMDLCEPSSISKGLARVNADIVIHLAAESFVGEVDANIYYRVNLIGTRNLLAALSNTIAKPSLTILASSANVYGNSQALKLNESSSVHPENDYAVSKLSMEYVAELFRDRLNITVVRPFNYTGVGTKEISDPKDSGPCPAKASHYRAWKHRYRKRFFRCKRHRKLLFTSGLSTVPNSHYQLLLRTGHFVEIRVALY